MAFLTCHFYSEALGNSTGINVILPTKLSGDCPTLYLLHGYSDDNTAWTRYTALERYARDYNVAVVMPDVQKSFYCDFVEIEHGYRYWSYVSEELISVTRKMFHLSHKREDTFVAGLSMGGFGAFKCALNRPDVFSAAGSFSGVVDMGGRFSPEDPKNPEFEMIMGKPSEFKGSVNDLFAAAEKTAKLREKPMLYQFCGTEDFLYEGNLRFRDFVKPLGFDYTYAETPGGHEWRLWDKQIEGFLKMLPLKKIDVE